MHILTAAGASAKSLRSIQSDNIHFAKEHNKCLGSKLRDIFIYNEYDTIKETQEPDKVGFVEVVKSEKWEVSRSEYDPSDCRI